MRLQEIKQILQQNIDELKVFRVNSNNGAELDNVHNFQKAILELEELNLFPQEISVIKNSAIFRRFDDSFAIEYK
ncbi:MAG: hypothetical protein ACR2MG_00545, partial [Pyrinomonadaceae bacterium]